MSKTRVRIENGSILRAIDGSHLQWNDFREDVLRPFGIKVANTSESNSIPSALYSRLQDRLLELSRFDHQRQRWYGQVTIGQGFGSTVVFPPNILPPISAPAKVQHSLAPKMSREALPRRSRAVNSLFELPSARPMYAAAFTTESFSDAEHLALPSSLSVIGTCIDFASGWVNSGRTSHCPFLVFERCQGTESDDVEKTLNMCAISGAQCLKGLQDIAQRALKKTSDTIFCFSCALNNTMATINIHTLDENGQYVMSALYKFDLSNEEHFNTFQAWIEAIEDWASTVLLPDLKDFLTKISHAGDTPPASPMPSLSLSIDTDVGTIPGLMQILRRTYPTVAWQGDELVESPINSSIAHCGTPVDGRRAQSLLLGSPTLSANTFSNLMLRRGRAQSVVSPINVRNANPYTPARPSPFSPRYMAGLLTHGSGLESPCRPGSLSPSTPPPDQPWTAKSPMLVLQKRMDVAMNEVQDLRHQVELLQTELAVKNQQLSEKFARMDLWQKEYQKQEEDRHRAREAERARAIHEAELVLRQQEQKKRFETPDIESDLDFEDCVRQHWLTTVLKIEGWDMFLEQFLFILALLGLLMIGLSVSRDFLPSLHGTFSLFNSDVLT